MSALKPSVSVFVLAALAPLADAGQGAIEINAACVADGCFSGDSGGYPVTISSAGSYLLTSNLTVTNAATSAISIGADDVTLDLNGFAVRGPVSCTDIPVTSCTAAGFTNGISTSQRATVRNGSVSGFEGYGISTDRDSVIDNVVVSQNGSGGISPYRSTVRSSRIALNGGNGIQATSGGGNAKVVDSHIHGNQGYGADMSSGLVLSCTISNNGSEGLRSGTGGGNASYGHNHFLRNNSSGAQVSGGVAIACNNLNGTASCP